MLTLDQCIDLCGLNDEEVERLARHASVPEIVAAQMACKMLQTREGIRELECILHRRLAETAGCGDCAGERARPQGCRSGPRNACSGSPAIP
jgi:hypothetical protein